MTFRSPSVDVPGHVHAIMQDSHNRYCFPSRLEENYVATFANAEETVPDVGSVCPERFIPAQPDHPQNQAVDVAVRLHLTPLLAGVAPYAVEVRTRRRRKTPFHRF